MYPIRGLAWICLISWASATSANAQSLSGLPVWQPDTATESRLGSLFRAGSFSIKPPMYLIRVGSATSSGTNTTSGYWSSTGTLPDDETLFVLAGDISPSDPPTLDLFVDKMIRDMVAKRPGLRYSMVRKGNFNGHEARVGSFTVDTNGSKVTAYYLVGKDDRGYYFVQASIPNRLATRAKIEEMKASILTFKRS